MSAVQGAAINYLRHSTHCGMIYAKAAMNYAHAARADSHQEHCTMPDPARLRSLTQFAAEAPAFLLRYLRWLIANAEKNGFGVCIVRVGSRILVDRDEVAAWLDQLRAQPQPHSRGRKPQEQPP